MAENSKFLSDQEIDELMDLIDDDAAPKGMSKEFKDVAEWFLPAAAASSEFEMVHDRSPPKPAIASATIRRRGLKWAPLCFGSPYYFEPTSKACSDCKFQGRCGAQAAHQALGLVRGRRLPAPYPDHIMYEPHDTSERSTMRHHIRGYYTRQSGNSRNRGLKADREYRRKRRTKADIASIEREFRARLTALRRAVAAPRHNKMLEQLRGREIQVVRAWKAVQLARLNYGLTASNEKVAGTYRTLIKGAVSYSRHQARNDRRLIKKLERVERVWGKFKRAAP